MIGCDSACPCTECRMRIKSASGVVDSPERFHSQILSDTRVSYDSHNPAIHLGLELPKQCLESFDIAFREALQQFHFFPSISSYELIVRFITFVFGPGEPNG